MKFSNGCTTTNNSLSCNLNQIWTSLSWQISRSCACHTFRNTFCSRESLTSWTVLAIEYVCICTSVQKSKTIVLLFLFFCWFFDNRLKRFTVENNLGCGQLRKLQWRHVCWSVITGPDNLVLSRSTITVILTHSRWVSFCVYVKSVLVKHLALLWKTNVTQSSFEPEIPASKTAWDSEVWSTPMTSSLSESSKPDRLSHAPLSSETAPSLQRSRYLLHAQACVLPFSDFPPQTTKQ